ncbi:Potassium channel AKT1 [Camellia lanceoleosa]|uniref:Potassium channel AKT1 n=1 Tax=Camellia lanceoleosa TaxID=1840588 RepID=A0ACC0IDI7_9ERIC|nr:Potassium channel AKT1 [Camellia lanceoleosa]
MRRNRGGVSMCGPEQEMEQLSREGSHYSLTTGILPSLGARSNRIVLVLYTAWVSPFEFGFLEKPDTPLTIADNVVNGFFAVDIILTLFVAYLDKATYVLIDDRKKIAWKYASTWLVFDVISTIPLPFQSFGLFNMLSLWRLQRVSALFARLEKDRKFSYFWVRCVKLFCVTLFADHCVMRFYYLLAASYHDPRQTWIGQSIDDFLHQSLWIRYITTLKTVGYERYHSSSIKFYPKKPIAHSLARSDACTLIIEVQNRLEWLQQTETLDSLPKAIRSSISHFLFYSLVNKVSEMKAEYFPPKEDVILQNEAPTDFYILVNGAVELRVFKNGAERVIGEATTGELCGEIVVLCYRPQLFTVRTKRLSQLLRMNRTTFMNIVQANVGDGAIITNNLLQHLKEAKDPIMEEVLLETENMLARGRMDLPLSLCFAALRGDDLLLHQGLKRGLDPNESDKNGRTALHIAASKRSENCVLLPLDYRANPNSRGIFLTFMPVIGLFDQAQIIIVIENSFIKHTWEAMMANREHVVKILTDNGATISSGDVGQFSCTAAEQNNLDLLKEIVSHGADVTLLNSNGSNTALHVAVSEANTDIVKFLLDQGADIDQMNSRG